MSYGSTIAVEDAEDEWREETARAIAMHAAELVAARDMTREAAITAAVEHQRYCQEAERDPTGTVATLNNRGQTTVYLGFDSCPSASEQLRHP